jgi:nucleoside-diphosphate-sugar epimerase
LQDGGPILIPAGPGLPIRHVYGEDVVQAIVTLLRGDTGKGAAYNIGQDETVSLEDFLQILARLAQRPLQLVRLPRETLDRAGLLPHCSPFSGQWMSSLDNAHSKTELGMKYTPMSVYTEKLVRYFQATSARQVPGYAQRRSELLLAGVAQAQGKQL